MLSRKTLTGQPAPQTEIFGQAMERLANRDNLPGELVAELLADRDVLPPQGEEREATVLFADLRGFTGLAEDRSPVEVLHLVNRCFGVLVQCVRAESGMLDKFLGDGLMAVFGVPFAHSLHVHQGIRAAQAMQAAMAALLPDLEGEGWRGVGLGVGIESGHVVAGNVGVPERQDFTVLGDVVNVASRLTAGALAGEVVLGARARVAVGDAYPLTPLGLITIRGRRQPVDAWRLA